jgi:hypothetical protein
MARLIIVTTRMYQIAPLISGMRNSRRMDFIQNRFKNRLGVHSLLALALCCTILVCDKRQPEPILRAFLAKKYLFEIRSKIESGKTFKEKCRIANDILPGLDVDPWGYRYEIIIHKDHIELESPGIKKHIKNFDEPDLTIIR